MNLNEFVRLQASRTVDGVNLKEILIHRPDLIHDALNLENYTNLFLMGLLTDLHDGKPDNFIATLHSDRRSIEIIGKRRLRRRHASSELD